MFVRNIGFFSQVKTTTCLLKLETLMCLQMMEAGFVDSETLYGVLKQCPVHNDAALLLHAPLVYALTSRWQYATSIRDDIAVLGRPLEGD